MYPLNLSPVLPFVPRVLEFYQGNTSNGIQMPFLLEPSYHSYNNVTMIILLYSLSPYSFDVSPSCMDAPQVTHDTIPIGAIPLLASSSSDYQDAVSRVVMSANQVYHDFIKSEEGRGFTGQICFVGDSVGSILTYDALSRATQHSRHSSENSILEGGSGQQGNDNGGNTEDAKHLSAPSPRRRSSGTG